MATWLEDRLSSGGVDDYRETVLFRGISRVPGTGIFRVTPWEGEGLEGERVRG